MIAMQIKLITSCSITQELQNNGYPVKYMPKLLLINYSSQQINGPELVIYPTVGDINNISDHVVVSTVSIDPITDDDFDYMISAENVEIVLSFDDDADDTAARSLVSEKMRNDPINTLCFFAIDNEGLAIDFLNRNISYVLNETL